jgi:hypothetical protein
MNFDSCKPGALPPEWKSAMTHPGGAAKWEILHDATAPSKPNVIAQTSDDKTGSRFPLAVYQKANFTDGELSVDFKAISGSGDQAAGLVWRYRDENNYYIVRANALEDNVVLYKVQDGKRVSLAPKGTPPKTYGVKHKVPSQTWSNLHVKFQGPQFTVYFAHKEIFQVEDSTFTGPGQAGLWTKADSVTHFDNFRIRQD